MLRYPLSIDALSPLYQDFVDSESTTTSNVHTGGNDLIKSPEFRLSAFFVNSRSLCNKMSLLRAYVNECNPLIVCITETWCHDGISDAFLKLDGYCIYRCDRSGAVGGGVIIFVHASIPSVIVSKFDSCGSEAVACRMFFPKNDVDLTLCCVYSPPSYQLDQSPLLAYMSGVASEPSRYFVMCGDFNAPSVTWNNLEASLLSAPIVDWAMNNFLTQHVCTPTRPESKTILDLVFSSVDTSVENLKVEECFGSSDHAIITFHVSIPSTAASQPSMTKIPLFSKGKWCLYRAMLMESYWPESSSLKIDELWDIYRSNILRAASASIPQVAKRDWKPQNSSKVRTAIRRHRRLCRLLQNDSSLASKLRLHSSVLSLNKVVYSETCRHESRVSKTLYTNPKNFWSYVKSKTNLRDTISVIKDSKGEYASDPRSIANCFSNHFASVFRNSALPSVPTPSSSSTKCILESVSFPLSQVQQCIKRLPPSTSADPEGLCYELVKRGGSFLASKLSYFFGRSMEVAHLPKSWKHAKITPVFKSGSRDQCANYRPIALTSCISRIMERIISSQILCAFRLNHAICDTQHGFLPGRSIETAGVEFLDEITRALDDGMCNDAVFLDYSKAFDTVPHALLIDKLTDYGIAGCLLRWISDYLTDRYQYVRIKDQVSSSVPITSGVIQGSVLGPLLFLIFINDVDKCTTHSSVIKYADDIKLFITFPSDHASQLAASRKLQTDFLHLHDWSSRNGLSLNLSKCKVMHFGTTNVRSPIHLNDEVLDEVNCIKDLGVFMTSSCIFNHHVAYIVSKANKSLGLVKKVFVSRDENVFLHLYKARVRSILEYGSILWDPYRKYLSDSVEKVQRRFTRIFPHLRDLTYQERLRHLKLLSLSARRLRYKLIFLYKIVNNLVDVNPDDYFRLSIYTSTRGNPVKIIPPFSRKDCRRYFFTVDTIFHWNNLFKHEIDVQNVAAFKKSITSYFDRTGIW